MSASGNIIRPTTGRATTRLARQKSAEAVLEIYRPDARIALDRRDQPQEGIFGGLRTASSRRRSRDAHRRHPRTAKRIATELGIDGVMAEVLPGDKSAKVAELQATERRSQWWATE